MNDEILAGAVSLTKWAMEDAERNRDIDMAILNLQRIYKYLTDTE